MGIGNQLRKWLLYGIWLSAGSGLVVLLVAAMKDKKAKQCSGIAVRFSGERTGVFLTEKEVIALLAGKEKTVLTGRPLQDFNLKKLEDQLEKNYWIADAELYFDNQRQLQVKVVECQPIARLFTRSGQSFYIDSTLHEFPLSPRKPYRVPVFTGFAYDFEQKGAGVNLALQKIKRLSQFISADSFWSAQTAQIDINAQQEFEWIPSLGKQVVELGDGDRPEEVFHRLGIYYRQIVPKLGLDYYDRVRVQFTGQVLGVRNSTTTSSYDTSAAQLKIQQMIKESLAQQEKNLATQPSVDEVISVQNVESAAVVALVASPSKKNIGNPTKKGISKIKHTTKN
jgi:cell division protein FtsQ